MVLVMFGTHLCHQVSNVVVMAYGEGVAFVDERCRGNTKIKLNNPVTHAWCWHHAQNTVS